LVWFWETVLGAKALLTKSEESIFTSFCLWSFSSFPSLLKGGRNRYLGQVFFILIKLFIYLLLLFFDVAIRGINQIWL
jgi:hypothetical protein